MELCEENYLRISRLVPHLHRLSGLHRSPGCDGIALYLEVLEQSRFTTELRLTYRFHTQEPAHPDADPDVRLRVYHDSRQVEVLGVRQSALALDADYQPPALTNKWRVNLFLAKWLQYCLRRGHGFDLAATAADPADAEGRLQSTCAP